jgi:hypothetical protein
MRRLRRRLDGLEAHAHQTMSGADVLLAAAKDLIDDLQDGVTIEAEFLGKTFPISIRILPDEGE